MGWQELQTKPEEKQQMQKEAWDKYTDRDTHVIKKGTGRRPAPQNTRQEWDDKSFRPNHKRSNRCKGNLEIMWLKGSWLKKELAAGQLHEIQDKNDKSLRSNHTRSNRCKEKLETSTQTETHMRKDLDAGQLHNVQEKNEMTRGSDQSTGEASDVKRCLRQVHRQRQTCD